MISKSIQINPTQAVNIPKTVDSLSQSKMAQGQPAFSEVLQNTHLTFSKHAQNRLESRQIALNDNGLARLEAAVQKAEKRGGQDSLILMDDMAFIVNVKNRMVVTAMDASKRGEGVFTKIDSVVLADSPDNGKLSNG
ncbi:MAG: TIGR02530 family flagellar biosynthesis protein [Chloroflexota bacterium]